MYVYWYLLMRMCGDGKPKTRGPYTTLSLKPHDVLGWFKSARFRPKRGQKGVDHARDGPPLPLTRCVRDEVGQPLCAEFAKELAKCHLFARNSLA